MRERASILILAATALAALLFTVSRHQSLLEEREKTALARRETAALAERLAALQAQIAQQPSGPDPSRVEAALAALETKLETKLEAVSKVLGETAQVLPVLAELKSALGEVKDQIAAPETGVLARLEGLSRLREDSARLEALVTSLEARARDIEARLGALTAPREVVEAGPGAITKAAATEPVPERPPPATPVVTSVEAVEAARGVVVLAAGSTSGLEEGHTLWVSRDGRFIARLRVLKADEDLAGASVIELSPGEAIQTGDRASTLESRTQTAEPPAAKVEPTPGKVEAPLGKADPPPPPRVTLPAKP
ncbi:MAG TPA: hypothetical protein VMT52_02870 [Planctomycetota bacterium]|nr:hypothetical protein [Planctomycetota bacterium]